MAIKGRADKMLEHNPSPVAGDAFQQLVGLVAADGKVSLADLAKWIDSNVGFNKSSYKELVYTLFFVAEGKAPVWLGGQELPDIVTSKQQPRVNATPVQKAVDEPEWFKHLGDIQLG